MVYCGYKDLQFGEISGPPERWYLAADEIRAIREREHVSQLVFAAYLKAICDLWLSQVLDKPWVNHPLDMPARANTFSECT